MYEYLYENGVGKFTNTDLSDEEINYVIANKKLHANRKKKFKSRSVYCRGDLAKNEHGEIHIELSC